MNDEQSLGITIGYNTPEKVEFISNSTIQKGLYVCMECYDKVIIGTVTDVAVGNLATDDELTLPNELEKITKIIQDDYEYTRAKVKILGDIETLKIPRVAVKANTPVRRATSKELKKIFEIDGLNIGKLLTDRKVNTNVYPNELLNKHLAILATTGSGKSNTTAILIEELLKKHGCILLFDMHSEYKDITFDNYETNIITPRINLADLSYYEFTKLSGIKNAANQERILYTALKNVTISKNKDINSIQYNSKYKPESKKKLIESKDKEYRLEYLDKVISNLETMKNNTTDSNEKTSIEKVIDKITHNLNVIHKSILDEDMDNKLALEIKPDCLNILNFQNIDDKNTKLIINLLIKDILRFRKNYKYNTNRYEEAISFPIFCIFEEAHTLASKYEESKTKKSIATIAKEGRKFGVSLCLVSQRPNALDPEVLSQINNWILLKIVEPSDQRYIQECSDSISDDLIKNLTNLNTGEAIITGPLVKVPSICKIKYFKDKIIGENIDYLNEWEKHYESFLH